MIYQRGKRNTWWYRFRFGGRIVHESARSKSKTVARDAERQRRRELEATWNKLQKRCLPPIFERASREWQQSRVGRISSRTSEADARALRHLIPVFGPKLLCDISADDIAHYQRKRQREGVQGRTVNMEIEALRQVLTGISFLASRRLRGYTCLPPVWPSAHNIFPQMVPLAPFRPSGVLKTNALPASGSVFSDTAACRGSLRINFSAAKAELPRGHWQPSNPPHHRRKQPPCQMALRQQ